MHQMDCICAAVSEGLPDHCILVTSGGPSSLPIIISSAYSDYRFSVEKFFFQCSVSYLLSFTLILNCPCGRGEQLKYWLLLFSFLRLWMVASVSQLFLTVFQWWNKRMLQSLISADNVGSPPSRAVSWSLSSCFSWRILGASSGAENIGWNVVSTIWGQHQKKRLQNVAWQKCFITTVLPTDRL